jgi:serine O-acetyltransferase
VLKDFINSYKRNDPSIKSSLEVLFLLPGPKAVFFHKISHLLYRSRLFFLARFVSEFSRWLTGIEIHPGAKIGKNFVIDHGMGVVIGETAIVGDDCMIYHGVTLGGVIKSSQVKRHPTLKDSVVVGTGAKVLGNIIIGSRSKIGAGAVVVTDCEEDSVMVGMPAKNVSKSGAQTKKIVLEAPRVDH